MKFRGSINWNLMIREENEGKRGKNIQKYEKDREVVLL
tara:strand:- start:2542 stop:2655 length:114 start_codon:yes stop_codon:yes gene_type:complete